MGIYKIKAKKYKKAARNAKMLKQSYEENFLYRKLHKYIKNVRHMGLLDADLEPLCQIYKKFSFPKGCKDSTKYVLMLFTYILLFHNRLFRGDKFPGQEQLLEWVEHVNELEHTDGKQYHCYFLVYRQGSNYVTAVDDEKEEEQAKKQREFFILNYSNLKAFIENPEILDIFNLSSTEKASFYCFNDFRARKQCGYWIIDEEEYARQMPWSSILVDKWADRKRERVMHLYENKILEKYGHGLCLKEEIRALELHTLGYTLEEVYEYYLEHESFF